MQKLQPIFALYFARVFLQEKLSASFLFLAALALLGAVMLSFPDLIKIYNLESPWTSTDTQNTLLGYGYTLLSVIIWAAASIFGKKIFNQTSAYFSIQQVMSLRYFFGWIALACFFLFLSFSHEIDLSLLANYKNSTAIVCMVLISGIAGMGFYYQGVKILRPRNIIIAELWYPFTAIMVNKLVLGISLNFWQLLGAAILVLATFSVQNKKLE